MSFDSIGAVSPAQGTGPTGSIKRQQTQAPTEAVQAGDEAVEVETMPFGPPPDVRSAFAVASDAYDRLQASGRQVRFGVDASTGRLTAGLHDLEGNQLTALTPSQVLAIAGGEPV